jgi:hypothetical protein
VYMLTMTGSTAMQPDNHTAWRQRVVAKNTAVDVAVLVKAGALHTNWTSRPGRAGSSNERVLQLRLRMETSRMYP